MLLPPKAKNSLSEQRNVNLYVTLRNYNKPMLLEKKYFESSWSVDSIIPTRKDAMNELQKGVEFFSHVQQSNSKN